MRKIFILGLMLAAGSGALLADDFEDDIYYNPKKDNRSKTVKKNKQSQYIENFADLDVDTYNRRGQYYASPIDTIGRTVENGEDFVYTQQIQKYYNPTIVIDNVDVLEDVLSNSYGNVDIVIENGYPMFSSYSYSWPYWRNPWNWSYAGWGWGPGWYDPWYSWGPSWSWGWGPSWAWGPSWSWGPSWGWGPSWSWGWGPDWGWGGGRPSYAHHRPNGNRPVGPNPGWASDTRPGGNYNGGGGRPIYGSNSARPGSGNVTNGSNPTSRPGNYHRGGNSGYNGLHGMRPANSNNSGNNSDRGYRFNSGGHRVTGNSSNGTNSNRSNRQGYNRNQNNNNSNRYNYNNSTNRRTNSYNSGSYNSGGSHRSSGGSFGGGGGGRGRHR